MFPHRFFPSRMFAARYFAPATTADVPPVEPPFAPGGGIGFRFHPHQDEPRILDDDVAIAIALSLL